MFAARIQNVLPVFDKNTGTLLPGKRGLANIISSAGSCAPYLDGLIHDWPGLVGDLQNTSPEFIFKNILKDLSAETPPDLAKSLRVAKQKTHLLTALCDLGGVWTWSQVTETLSQFADMCMQLLIDDIAKDMGFKSNEYGAIPGLFVLALGKYGARELNYSSDIDLIVFYDPEYIKVPNPERAERTLIRFVKKLMRGFDEITLDGYVFRTDLRLRPDPRANAVAVSTRTAERYYETLGQNWERAAMIKARFCGGDRRAADEFIKNVLTPFIWRKNLDYEAIADIHSIKRQIQGGKLASDVVIAGHDLKLGIGGIREIEFFTQVQQLILGGRNQDLRVPQTIGALEALAKGRYADRKTINSLKNDYAVLRGLEHRVQMYEDQQTHHWPKDQGQRRKLAALCGAGNLDEFEDEISKLIRRVHNAYFELFAGEEDLSAKKGSLVFTGVEAEQATLNTLTAYKFTRGREVWAHMADWLGGRIRATRTPRARELLTRLAPRIIEACGATGAPDTAFFQFADFMTNLNAGVSLFSLLVGKPKALVSLIDMLVIAPPLAQMLAAQPALIDAMAEPDFLTKKTFDYENQYSKLLTPETDFEVSLNLVRRQVHEDQLNLTAGLLKLQNIGMAGQGFSDIAQAAILALLPQALKETQRRYGKISGKYAVLGLGKLGSAEMGLKSDLDIMLIYQPGPDEKTSDHQLYNRLTRRLITALSSVTEEGGLYEVDMALRPSGRSGPLAVSLEAFQKYYQTEAWTWEFMALSRARIITSSSDKFTSELDEIINAELMQKDYSGTLASDVLDMHERLSHDKPAKGTWDIKCAKGGLRDIEFIAQFLVLKHKPAESPRAILDIFKVARKRKWLTKTDADILSNATGFYQTLLQLLAVTFDGVFDPKISTPPLNKILAASVGEENMANLTQTYSSYRAQVKDIFSNTIRP